MIKRGYVKGMLHRPACDIVILQESKLEVVGCQVVVDLWGQSHVQWVFFPSMGCLRGINII